MDNVGQDVRETKILNALLFVLELSNKHGSFENLAFALKFGMTPSSPDKFGEQLQLTQLEVVGLEYALFVLLEEFDFLPCAPAAQQGDIFAENKPLPKIFS
jgi:hypothetical protein